MITFQGRQKAIRTADIIQRKAHSLYPHISSSKLNLRFNKVLKLSNPKYKLTPDLYQNVVSTLKDMRNILNEGNNYLTKLIPELKDKKVGNCFEGAILAMIIGRLNGQKNIYVGNILVKKENIENKRSIDHAVAFITDKKNKFRKEYDFKNKEAIIIDPWLNIVDYAGNYFTSIKNNYRAFFKEIPNQDFLQYLIGTNSKNIKEFRECRNNSCQHLNFSIRSNVESEIDKIYIEEMKSLYPELVIKNYKKITFPRKKKS